ncbi:MAG: hypothetical protein IJ214_10675, partial [Clostridia bacterium]|nr:hypothetical protein [Clostridia bacterium]
LQVLPAALIGTYAFVAGLQGYLFGPLNNWLLRFLLVVGGCAMIAPGLVSDLIGIVLLLAACGLAYWDRKRKKTAEA